jgi:hypothetical protein
MHLQAAHRRFQRIGIDAYAADRHLAMQDFSELPLEQGAHQRRRRYRPQQPDGGHHA